jgi:uncharacterized protein with GYD domain
LVRLLSEEEEDVIPIKHVRKDKTERDFKGAVVKDTPDYKLIKPHRVLFVQLVKFAPGKGPKDYVDAYKDIDAELKRKYGKTRCDMDCHEIATFLTFGRHDMVVLWDAPDLETYQRVFAASVNPGTGFGNTETMTVSAAMKH